MTLKELCVANKQNYAESNLRWEGWVAPTHQDAFLCKSRFKAFSRWEGGGIESNIMPNRGVWFKPFMLIYNTGQEKGFMIGCV